MFRCNIWNEKCDFLPLSDGFLTAYDFSLLDNQPSQQEPHFRLYYMWSLCTTTSSLNTFRKTCCILCAFPLTPTLLTCFYDFSRCFYIKDSGLLSSFLCLCSEIWQSSLETSDWSFAFEKVVMELLPFWFPQLPSASFNLVISQLNTCQLGSAWAEHA